MSPPASRQQAEGQDKQDDGIDGIEHQAGQVVTPGFQAKQYVLGPQDHPRERLIDGDPTAGPGPTNLRPPEATVERVFEKVLGVVP
jgi:hypothetical protein